jgi:endonuclease I
MKLIPCKICIESLRNKLFILKSECGMIPYSISSKLAKKWFYDLYTGMNLHQIDPNKINIEHSVLSTIMAPRPVDNNIIYINKEPFHDLHLLFPTVAEINSLRGNYIYGLVANNREAALKSQNVTKIINERQYFNKGLDKQSYQFLQKVNNPSQIEGPKEDDIYINDKYQQCPIGKCFFQPPKRYSGDLARIVFYFYLMYAYDFTVRPNTDGKIKLWFSHVSKKGDISKRVCYGFDFDDWKSFFYDHLHEYYLWAKEDPIDEKEKNKNIKIIELTNVPNIFVGYLNEKDKYIASDFDTIEELLFGKTHDHSKYTNIHFKKEKTCIKFTPGYEFELQQIIKQEGTTGPCQEKIIKENEDHKLKQEKLYGYVSQNAPSVKYENILRIKKGGAYQKYFKYKQKKN